MPVDVMHIRGDAWAKSDTAAFAVHLLARTALLRALVSGMTNSNQWPAELLFSIWKPAQAVGISKIYCHTS